MAQSASGRPVAHYHHTKAPENLLNVAVFNPAGHKTCRVFAPLAQLNDSGI
jgi:hypothetical protein